MLYAPVFNISIAVLAANYVSTIFQNIIDSNITILPSEVVDYKYNDGSPVYGLEFWFN